MHVLHFFVHWHFAKIYDIEKQFESFRKDNSTELVNDTAQKKMFKIFFKICTIQFYNGYNIYQGIDNSREEFLNNQLKILYSMGYGGKSQIELQRNEIVHFNPIQRWRVANIEKIVPTILLLFCIAVIMLSVSSVMTISLVSQYIFRNA